MEPKIKTPDPTLAKLLAQFKAARGVVDYVVFQGVNPERVDAEFHKKAATEALWEIDRRLAVEAVQLAPRMEMDIAEFPRLRIHPDRARGRKISKADFLGPCYDRNEGKLIVRGHVAPFLNEFFLAGAEIKAENIIPVAQHGDFSVSGYAQAFSQPPYGIDLFPEDLDDLFHRIGRHIYGDLADPMDIHEWAGPWSSYFDDGFQWWGAYLWSVCNGRSGQFAVIGASTTD